MSSSREASAVEPIWESLEAWHPDIEKFVTAKTKPGVFENFNVSVGIWDDFWKTLVSKDGNHKYPLRSPRMKEPMRQIDAQAACGSDRIERMEKC